MSRNDRVNACKDQKQTNKKVLNRHDAQKLVLALSNIIHLKSGNLVCELLTVVQKSY